MEADAPGLISYDGHLDWLDDAPNRVEVVRSRGIDDVGTSGRVSVAANPELVVATAEKPRATRTRADPVSHGSGRSNGVSAW